MSALNVILRHDAVHVLTDGAGYYKDGTIACIGQKVFTLAHQRAAIAARGALFFLPALISHVNEAFGSFDELVVGISSKLQEVLKQTGSILDASPFGRDYDLVIAGWSECANEPQLYLLFTHDKYGVPAFKLTRETCGYFSPMNESLVGRLATAGVNLHDSKSDPVETGLRIVCEQRATRWDQEGGSEIQAIGGFCQLTTVERDNISSRILCRWIE